MLSGISINAVAAERKAAEFVSELAEGVGFEPTMRLRRIAVFKTAPFNHSGTPPLEC